MSNENGNLGSSRGTATYAEPRLVIHGTVQALTAGPQGNVPDTAASGSQFGDGANP